MTVVAFVEPGDAPVSFLDYVLRYVDRLQDVNNVVEEGFDRFDRGDWDDMPAALYGEMLRCGEELARSCERMLKLIPNVEIN